MKSTPEHEHYMRVALEEAKAAVLENEVPVGAVLVKGGSIVARSHNQTVKLQDPTAHAELLVIRSGLQALSGRLNGCTLYVTLEPCAMCAGAMVNTKLEKLVFGAFDERAGCCGSVLDLTDHALSFSVETWGGVLETECSGLLTNFFRQLR